MKKNIINFTIILSFVFSSVSIYAQKEYKLIPMDSIQGLDVSEEFALCKQHIYEKSQITLVKDEFEKSSDFDMRVEKAKKTYEIISYEYGKSAILRPLDTDSLNYEAYGYFIKKNQVGFSFDLGEYDPENEFFSVNVSFTYNGERKQYGVFKLPIPIKDAKIFKDQCERNNYETIYEIVNLNTTRFLTMTNARYFSFYEYVDLGLSVKWATCNIAAYSPEQHGYNVSFPEAVRNKRLDGGRLPLKDEIYELFANCDNVWTTKNGVPGFELISKKNGNSIFLPVTHKSGCYDHDKGSGGYYWFGDPDDIMPAHYLYFNLNGKGNFFTAVIRECKQAVRLVQDVK